MIKSFPVTKRQVSLLESAQKTADQAQAVLQVVCATVLAGLDTEGTLQSVDNEKLTVSVELPDEPKE